MGNGGKGAARAGSGRRMRRPQPRPHVVPKVVRQRTSKQEKTCTLMTGARTGSTAIFNPSPVRRRLRAGAKEGVAWLAIGVGEGVGRTLGGTEGADGLFCTNSCRSMSKGGPWRTVSHHHASVHPSTVHFRLRKCSLTILPPFHRAVGWCGQCAMPNPRKGMKRRVGGWNVARHQQTSGLHTAARQHSATGIGGMLAFPLAEYCTMCGRCKCPTSPTVLGAVLEVVRTDAIARHAGVERRSMPCIFVPLGVGVVGVGLASMTVATGSTAQIGSGYSWKRRRRVRGVDKECNFCTTCTFII